MTETDYIRTYLKLCYEKSNKIPHNGYIWIKLWDHPNHFSGGYVCEHRFLMELKLGRYLTRKEVVHHKNGIRNDNSMENLELLDSQSKHISTHNNERQYKRTDTSGRVCLKCGGKTRLTKRGFWDWFIFKDGWQCRKCYDKVQSKIKWQKYKISKLLSQ